MKLENGAFVLALDGAKMLLFRNEGDAKYPVLETMVHEEVESQASHEQGQDRPGRSFASQGPRRSAYSETDWHDEAEREFLRQAVGRAEAAIGDEKGEIVVIAPPAALGEVRQHYPQGLARRICAEIGKDVVHATTDAIVAAIAAHEQQ